MRHAVNILTLVALLSSSQVALAAPSTAMVAPRGVTLPKTGLGRAWQRAALNVRQARRQVSAIKANRRLSRWARLRKSVWAVARSVGPRRPPAVLLYQGAFDPVHKGHLRNIEAAMGGVKNVRQVVVVPTSSHPGKEPVAHRHRVAMLKKSLASLVQPAAVRASISVVSNTRLARLSMEGFKDLTGTVHQRFPGARVYIMTGADAYLEAARSGLVAKALSLGYRYAVTPREGYTLPRKLPVGVEVMPLSGGGESSSGIRRAFQASHLPASMLAPGTADYIERNGLYGAGGVR